MLENRHQKAKRILKEVVRATQEGSYVYTPEAVWSILVKKGFVEVNEEMKNEAGEFATRATEAGIAEIPKEEQKMNAPKFEIESIPVEKSRRSNGKESIYPFDKLEVGQSFFVPASEEKPEPWKSMATTVSTATRRYAEPVMDEAGEPVMRQIMRGPNKGQLTEETKNTRVFAITKDTKDGVDGARIGRTQ